MLVDTMEEKEIYQILTEKINRRLSSDLIESTSGDRISET